MKHAAIKLNMTNSQILAIVQSLTIDKINFDSLSREDSSDVLYIMNQAYRTILLEIESLKNKLSRLDGTAEDVRRWIHLGDFNFIINLNTTRNSSPANFGQCMIEIEI